MVIFKINYNNKIGKNTKGSIITRHKSKGKKSLYIPIDLNYFDHAKYDGCYINLFDVKNNNMYRNTKLILGMCLEKNKHIKFRYILKPCKKSYGDFIKFSKQSSKQYGSIGCLNNFDINDKLYNIEFSPKSTSKICMSAECCSTLISKKDTYNIVKLPSNRRKILHSSCYSAYGKPEKFKTSCKNNAGSEILLGNRPEVRGSAMNACDHPHGGGEGKSPIGKKSIYSFKGKKVKGVKTVKFKK